MVTEAFFCPAKIDFSNLNEQIYEGSGQVSDNGVLHIDLGKLSDHSTATVCLLVALARVARQRQCRLNVVHINEKLRKLLNLYQISDWWPDK